MRCRFFIAVTAALLLSQATAFAQPQPHAKAAAAKAAAEDTTVIIPLGGNAWGDFYDDMTRAPVSKRGITHWADYFTGYKVWFRLSHSGMLQIALKAGKHKGKSDTVSLTLGGDTHQVKIKGKRTRMFNAGAWEIRDTGYQCVVIKLIHRGSTNPSPLDIQSLTLSGPATAPPMSYVPNDKGNFFYWGRRGPSVHLNYAVPDTTAKIAWFYNEVTVPYEGERLGSYYMADGFSVGYFGMQANGIKHRILFSVWSPFTTDDPKAIPDSLRINLVRKGDSVHAGTFGGEGAGGQSYLEYPWQPGNTYRFLLHAQPQADSHTRFTAWFYPPEQGHWLLIACWDRPATHTWLTHLHSFLENFEPEQGDGDRFAYYGNQWIGDSTGHWTPLTRARFTGDNTARKGYRHDYQGGLHGDTFFLHDGGFFNTYTPLDSWFERPTPRQISPPFNVDELP